MRSKNLHAHDTHHTDINATTQPERTNTPTKQRRSHPSLLGFQLLSSLPHRHTFIISFNLEKSTTESHTEPTTQITHIFDIPPLEQTQT
jgi:hypothetical protein